MIKLILGIIAATFGSIGLFISFWLLRESGQDHSFWSYSPPFIVSIVMLGARIYGIWKGYNMFPGMRKGKS